MTKKWYLMVLVFSYKENHKNSEERRDMIPSIDARSRHKQGKNVLFIFVRFFNLKINATYSKEKKLQGQNTHFGINAALAR